MTEIIEENKHRFKNWNSYNAAKFLFMRPWIKLLFCRLLYITKLIGSSFILRFKLFLSIYSYESHIMFWFQANCKLFQISFLSKRSSDWWAATFSIFFLIMYTLWLCGPSVSPTCDLGNLKIDIKRDATLTLVYFYKEHMNQY